MPALLSGFTAGKASSAQVNKVIRQASFIAAALAQFVSDKTQRDVLDNGDLPGFVELLGSGFAVEYLSRKNPFGDIKSDGTVKTALENLGLGEAAKRNVGTGANQIPDMGSFTLSVSGTGYQKLPSGFILQWGSIGAPGIAQDVVTHFPIAFPNRCLRVLVSQDYTPDSGAVGYIACAGFSPDPVKFISRASTPGLGASFLALGC
ncbi:gp53-like domain-containing protein [Escherichia coli]|uniref:gp53-like domain-containing protein n=1 Tax=Escherichia coli TaxID=562 RepID=UPI0002C9FD4A|nr:putative fels-2 prophage Pin [Escherichia coli 2850400]